MAKEFERNNAIQIENMITLFEGVDKEVLKDPRIAYVHHELLSDTDVWFNIPVGSSVLDKIRALPAAGYFRVMADSRPDLISFEVYGDSLLSHIIMIYNDVMDFRQIKTGDIIYFPSLPDILGVLIDGNL